MTAFVEPGNVADALLAFSRNSKGAMPTLPKSMAKSAKVTTMHLGYKVRKPINKVATTSARNTFFNCEEFGGRISVENYFKKSEFHLHYND
jgi:eukaryotic translation initiation factor 2C